MLFGADRKLTHRGCGGGGSCELWAGRRAGHGAVWFGADYRPARLVHIMRAYQAITEPLHVVYPHALHLTPRVRQFADFALDKLGEDWSNISNQVADC
jgi:hypothetical protein